MNVFWVKITVKKRCLIVLTLIVFMDIIGLEEDSLGGTLLLAVHGV